MAANQTSENSTFSSYDEYMKHVFDCVNRCLSAYLENMKGTFSNGQGGYKNVLYPDLEIASDAALDHVMRFENDGGSISYETTADVEEERQEDEEDDDEDVDEELLDLLSAFGSADDDEDDDAPEDDESDGRGSADTSRRVVPDMDVIKRIESIQEKAARTVAGGVEMPFYELCEKMKFEPFTVFCFACGILSSTQTDYAGIFQIVNENGGLSSPTIESAGRLYYGKKYSITGAYADMSICLEQLLPVLDLHVIPSMPFSTAVSPDKRIIDFLFGRDRFKPDENYSRFIKMLTDDHELDPILANEGQLESMKISYNEGVRIFSYYGDEGSGRKFFIKHFCRYLFQNFFW